MYLNDYGWEIAYRLRKERRTKPGPEGMYSFPGLQMIPELPIKDVCQLYTRFNGDPITVATEIDNSDLCDANGDQLIVMTYLRYVKEHPLEHKCITMLRHTPLATALIQVCPELSQKG